MQIVPDDRDFEIANRREDFTTGAARGDPRDLRDDEIVRLQAFRGHDLLLDLPRLTTGEFRLRPEQDRADPRFPLVASTRDALQVVARHVDRPLPIREAALVRGQDQVPRDRLVDREAAAHPFAQDPVEQVRLVAVHEHQEEVERQLTQRSDGIVWMGRQMVQDRLLEAVRLRIGAEGRRDVPRVPQGRAHPVGLRALTRDRIRDVRVDRVPKLAANDVSPDDMGDWPHRAEPLDPEKVREPTADPQLPRGFGRDYFGSLRRYRKAPNENAKPVADEVSDLERAIGRVRVKDLDVFHPQRGKRLHRDVFEGKELRGKRALVLRPPEPDSPAADVQRPRELAHEAIRLPVSDADRRNRVRSVCRFRRWRRDLLDDAIVRRRLRGPADARARGLVASGGAASGAKGMERVRRFKVLCLAFLLSGVGIIGGCNETRSDPPYALWLPCGPPRYTLLSAAYETPPV